jgi:hypothetical protein
MCVMSGEVGSPWKSCIYFSNGCLKDMLDKYHSSDKHCAILHYREEPDRLTVTIIPQNRSKIGKVFKKVLH